MGQADLFRQITLSKEQLQAGLAHAVDEVDIAWEPIAMTGIRATELEGMSGIKFQKSFDDLDEGYFAVLHFPESFGVTLIDYPEAPVKGTRICTDPVGQHSMSRLKRILEALNVSRDQLIWTINVLE
jgi:hypothetical protein